LNPRLRTGIAGLATLLAALAIAACGEDESDEQLPFTDAANSPDVQAIWGEYACAKASRIGYESEGGVDDGPFRRFTVIDGDDVDGERCELGRNDQEDSPTAVYGEGDRRITRLAVRLPKDFPLDTKDFQVVMQMKQTQPAANGDGTPALSLEAREGHWVLLRSTSVDESSETEELWSAPAEKGVWTRFEFDVTYSQDPEKGSVKVTADLDGDGEFEEESEVIPTYTLKRETEGNKEDELDPGDSIPSHLRIGLYHNPKIPCPAPKGCYVDIDEVEIVEPS